MVHYGKCIPGTETEELEQFAALLISQREDSHVQKRFISFSETKIVEIITYWSRNVNLKTIASRYNELCLMPFVPDSLMTESTIKIV